jgi:hypothetical protein
VTNKPSCWTTCIAPPFLQILGQFHLKSSVDAREERCSPKKICVPPP